MRPLWEPQPHEQSIFISAAERELELQFPKGKALTYANFLRAKELEAMGHQHQEFDFVSFVVFRWIAKWRPKAFTEWWNIYLRHPPGLAAASPPGM